MVQYKKENPFRDEERKRIKNALNYLGQLHNIFLQRTPPTSKQLSYKLFSGKKLKKEKFLENCCRKRYFKFNRKDAEKVASLLSLKQSVIKPTLLKVGSQPLHFRRKNLIFLTFPRKENLQSRKSLQKNWIQYEWAIVGNIVINNDFGVFLFLFFLI